ncbi:MAG: hypothetical protein SXQ77_04400, partial [Halobacteria archaeon]|nr:hypothetical protein [Halobacteria archaeon]
MKKDPSTSTDSDTDGNGGIDRRKFLRRAGASTAGLTALGAGAGAGTASARPSLFGGCVKLRSAPSDFPWVDADDGLAENGNIPQGPDEMVIYANGWLAGRISSQGQDQAWSVSKAAEAAGYQYPVIGFAWRSVMTWARAKVKVVRMGRNLARYVDDYKSRYPDTTIHIVG